MVLILLMIQIIREISALKEKGATEEEKRESFDQAFDHLDLDGGYGAHALGFRFYGHSDPPPFSLSPI